MSLWLLALSCSIQVSPTEDARVFAQVLSKPKAPGAMAVCLEIADANTQGECQLIAALNRPDQGVACSDVVTDLYQDECFFKASEAARRQGDLDTAVTLCRGAGVFVPDCQQHLWQGALRRVMLGRSPFSVRYAKAKPVFCTWSEEIGESLDYEERFWEMAWNSALSSGMDLNIEPCSELGASQRERCEKSGAQLLASRFDEVMVHPDARKILCEGDLSEVQVLQYTPHPVLDAVVARHRNAVCVEGLERPEGRASPEITPDPDKVVPEDCESK